MNGSNALVTFSFDDGDDDDVKAAEYLACHRMKATFYVATSRIGKEVSAEVIRYLASIGMEIGSHTVTHADVRRSSAHAWAMELYDSRRRLEDLLGMGVQSFCYPYGHFRRSKKEMVLEAGYALARTTQDFATARAFDPLLMPVSLQLYPHSRFLKARHAARELNPRILRAGHPWLSEPSYVDLVRHFGFRAQRTKGILHLWGHAVELKEPVVWRLFVDSVAVALESDLASATNSECLPDRAS